jgi:hypothetical protein
MAAEPFEVGDKHKSVIIETKSEGGYVVTRPSPPECHQTGRCYVSANGVPLTAVPMISDDERAVLLDMARAFDERPSEEPQAPPPPKATTSDFATAAREYNIQHTRDWKAAGGKQRTCPICQHNGCFGALPDDPGRWACFSSNHDGVGVQGAACWHGDALDLDAHVEGVDRVALLRKRGLMAPLTLPNHRGDDPPPLGRPTYTYRPGEGHDAIAFALGVIAKTPIVYQRDQRLTTVITNSDDEKDRSGVVRVVGSPIIAQLSQSRLWEILSSEVDWLRWSARRKKPVKRDPPNQVTKNLFSRGEYPGVRRLRGLSTVPIMRPDGSLFHKPGWDPITGVVHVSIDQVPDIPAKPTRDDAHRALDAILDAVVDFPFAAATDRSVWLAALLTPIGYPSFDGGAPLFLIDASTPGTGKSLVVNVIGVIASGGNLPSSPYVRDDDELRKRITSHVEAGDTMALIDNVPGGSLIGWPCLDSALTSSEWSDRRLGKSETVRGAMAITWYATGNNVGVRADMARRVLRCRLETNLENPESRTGFKHDPLMPWVRKHRPRLLAAALTILRGFVEAGRPDNGLAGIGSFEGWSSAIRNACVWLGLDDPGLALASKDPEIDPDVATHKRLLLALHHIQTEGLDLAPTGLNSREIVELADTKRDGADMLRGALLDLAGTRGGELPTPRRLGYALRKYKARRRRVDLGHTEVDLMLSSKTDRTGVARWVVEVADEALSQETGEL